MPQIEQVRDVVAEFPDPETGRPLGETNQVGPLRFEGENLFAAIGLTTHSAPLWEETRQALAEQLQAKFPAVGAVEVEVTPHERPPEKIGEVGLEAKSVIAIGSGKGGVGKSTLAVALAVGLSRAGCKVGLMDADVYGPSVPHLLGLEGRPQIDDNRILPNEKHGLKVMSMGFLVPPGEAVVWRGPMLHGAITQFLRDTNWGQLDYLIIDMPPGTGDIALTLSQLLPLSGAVVVCTPQEVALLDAVKAIAMFQKVNIHVLGMVENMSGFICPDCEKRYDIFGAGGARDKAEELEVPFLGEVPINMQIRTSGDAGDPAASFEDPLVAPYLERICHRLVQSLSQTAVAEPPLPAL